MRSGLIAWDLSRDQWSQNAIQTALCRLVIKLSFNSGRGKSFPTYRVNELTTVQNSVCIFVCSRAATRRIERFIISNLQQIVR